MANERLRGAMAAAPVTIDELAERVQVDPKTVQRWLAGRRPYARHRWAVAQAVDEDERYLWPPEGVAADVASTAEVVAAYAHRAHVPPRAWWKLLTAAKQQVDLLGYAMQHLPDQHPKLVETLAKKAVGGCRIRVALVDPDSPEAEQRDTEEGLHGGLVARIRTATLYFTQAEAEGMEIRRHRTVMYNSIFRFDDVMYVTPHLFAIPGSRAPLLHLRRRGPRGIFDGFADHFERIWQTSAPLELEAGWMGRIEHINDPDAPKANSLVPAASAIVVDDEGRILLHRRSDNKLWSIPGGAMAIGETIAQTVVREVREETGLEVEPSYIVGVYSDPNHVVEYDDGESRQQFSVCFACQLVGGEVAPGDESLQARFFVPDEIGSLDVTSSIRLRISDYLQDKRATFR